MSVIQTCLDTKDVLDLFRAQGLYLKPISRLNVSVQLPQLKKSGAKISNWEVMERVKEMAKPFTFPLFKVAKSSLEFIRFEAEIENFGSMDQVLAKLDMKTIKLSGFQELLKVRAAEAKTPFPTRNDWDSFFRDNKNMNEMKAGERPDTIHVQNLPTKWFVNHQDKSGVSKDKPSEFVVKKVFGTFGEIRVVDIPILDPYREKMKTSISGIQTFSFGQDLVFDAYIQYKEYIGFVKAMNSLKGMKLLFKDRYEERSWVANIKVQFDKSKHLAEATIKKRGLVREKLIEKERERDEAERRKKELEELKRSDELRRMEEGERAKEKEKMALKTLKEKRRFEREKRRRQQKFNHKFGEDEDEDEEAMAHKIAIEERKLLIAQRKLESIRLLDELLDRVKVVKSKGSLKSIEEDLLKTAAKEAKGIGKAATILSKSYRDQDEKKLRDKLVGKLKKKEEERMAHLGKRIRKLGDESELSDESVEDISDDELEGITESELSEENDDISAGELKLTTSTDEEEFVEKQKQKTKKIKKKEKKEKKRKKKEKKKLREEEKLSKNKRLELENQISLAQKISNRERRSRSRDEEERSRSGHRERHHRESSQRARSRSQLNRKSQVEEGYPDYRSRRAEERLQQRLKAREESKKIERAQEEMYDKMVNPHLYGDGEVRGGGYRKIKPGEHYEEVQRKELENEIRIRERRERYKRQEEEARRNQYHRHVDRGYRGRSRGRGHHHQYHHFDERRFPPNPSSTSRKIFYQDEEDVRHPAYPDRVKPFRR